MFARSGLFLNSVTKLDNLRNFSSLALYILDFLM